MEEVDSFKKFSTPKCDNFRRGGVGGVGVEFLAIVFEQEITPHPVNICARAPMKIIAHLYSQTTASINIAMPLYGMKSIIVSRF